MTHAASEAPASGRLEVMGLRSRIAAKVPEDGPKIFGYSGNEDIPPHVVLAVFATIAVIGGGPILLAHLLGLGTDTMTVATGPLLVATIPLLTRAFSYTPPSRRGGEQDPRRDNLEP